MATKGTATASSTVDLEALEALIGQIVERAIAKVQPQVVQPQPPAPKGRVAVLDNLDRLVKTEAGKATAKYWAGKPKRPDNPASFAQAKRVAALGQKVDLITIRDTWNTAQAAAASYHLERGEAVAVNGYKVEPRE